MIKLKVEAYCHDCCDFKPEVIPPKKEILYCSNPFTGSTEEKITISDTEVVCAYAKRCAAMMKYLERKDNEEKKDEKEDSRMYADGSPVPGTDRM